MTATLPEVETPSFTDSQMYTAAENGLRATAEKEINEEITEDQANEDVTWFMARHGIHLDDTDRADAWEILKDAVGRLSCLELPHKCHCHDYRDDEIPDLILTADADIIASTRRLIGPRPAPVKR
jgi:hypothetical protein